MVIDITREERKKEQQKKEGAEKRNKEDGAQKDYYPPSPIYDPNFKEDTMPASIAKKQHPDPNYYPPTYVPKCRECPNSSEQFSSPSSQNKGSEQRRGHKGREQGRIHNRRRRQVRKQKRQDADRRIRTRSR